MNKTIDVKRSNLMLTSVIEMLHTQLILPLRKTRRKWTKLSPFVNPFKEKCQNLYKPHQNVAVEKQLLKSKHRSSIRQHIAKKPVKFGVKL